MPPFDDALGCPERERERRENGEARPATAGDVLEIGAKVIYGFKSDPGKNPWEKAAAETRASYRARMQELLNELSAEGYVVGR